MKDGERFSEGYYSTFYSDTPPANYEGVQIHLWLKIIFRGGGGVIILIMRGASEKLAGIYKACELAYNIGLCR